MRAKKRLEFSEDALLDIADIGFFYAVERGNPSAAEKVEAAIFNTSQKLEYTPEIGRRGSVEGTREFVIASYPYTLIYRLTASRVIVLSVLHQSRQYP